MASQNIEVRVKIVRFFAFAVVLFGAAACSSDSSEDEFRFPELTPFSPGVASVLHQIRDDMALMRGLEISPSLKEGTLTREQLRGVYGSARASMTAAEEREVEEFSMSLRLLGMIGPDDNYLDISEDQSTEQIAGFYVPGEKKLVLVDASENLSLSDELTVAHEYVHSFQQRWHDSKKLHKLQEQENTEYSTTIDCVIEGDATLAGYRYMAEKYGPGWLNKVQAEYDESSLDAPESASDEVEIPEAMDRYFYFNYTECFLFVSRVFELNGWDGINALYERPPATTEHILHPEKYFANEDVLEIADHDLSGALGDGWDLLSEGAFGEFDLYNFLLTLSGDFFESLDASEGWGAGRLVLYTAGGEVNGQPPALVHLTLMMDTPRDFGELRDALYGPMTQKGVTVDRAINDWTWQEDGTHGWMHWNAAKSRVDIAISTDEVAYDRTVGFLGTRLHGLLK